MFFLRLVLPEVIDSLKNRYTTEQPQIAGSFQPTESSRAPVTLVGAGTPCVPVNPPLITIRDEIRMVTREY